MLKLVLDVDGQAFDLEVAAEGAHEWIVRARKRGEQDEMAQVSGSSMAAAVAKLKAQLRQG